jgi:membrane protein implicated in regulation of membrane protease activity
MLYFLQESASEQGFLAQLQEALTPDLFTSWEFWAILSGILLIGEALTAGFLLGAFLPGTILACVAAVSGWGMETQLAGFSLGTLVGLALLRPIVLRKLASEAVPSNVDALLGASAIVTEAIAVGAVGRVKVSNEEWRARCDSALESGVQVRVVSVSGNTLKVTPQ